MTDPNRARPRSSKKRRALQTGGTGRAAGLPPGTQPVAAGRPRAGTASRGGGGGGIPTAWLAVIVVVVLAVGLGFATGTIRLGGGTTTDSFAGGSGGAGAGGSVDRSAPAGSDTTGGAGSGTPSGQPAGCPTSPPPRLAAGEKRLVTIDTAKGKILITVEADLGPLAAGNFVALVSCGFYDGLVFHRVVPNFVIQGGDPQGTGGGGPGYQFPDDPVTVPYVRGVVAMANSGANTNGSQFFIVLKDGGLDPLYSIFGRVTSGMEAVDAIAAAADQENPTHPIAMDKMTVSKP